MSKYTPVLDNAVGEMESESVALEEKRIALETAQKNLDKQQKDLLDVSVQTMGN